MKPIFRKFGYTRSVTSQNGTFSDFRALCTQRMPPDVYKESGEARLYASAEGQRVLQVFPSWPWTLFLYQWTAPDKLNLVKMWPLEWIRAPTIGKHGGLELKKFVKLSCSYI